MKKSVILVIILAIIVMIVVTINNMSLFSPSPDIIHNRSFNMTEGPAYMDSIHRNSNVTEGPAYMDSIIEAAQKELADGHIVYTNITKMDLNRTYEFAARIAINESTENMTKEFSPGPKELRTLKVYKAMEVTLTGDEFEIQPRSEETQQIPELIPGHNYGSWLWNVKPTSDGQHNLTLTAYAIITVPQLPEKKIHLETIRVPINVTVEKKGNGPISLLEIGNNFLGNEENWKWIIATILIPIIGWLYKKKSGKGKDKDES
jgi:hypothetical protein